MVGAGGGEGFHDGGSSDRGASDDFDDEAQGKKDTGTGKNADAEHAYKTMRLIRKVVGELIGAGAARKVRVLYGGSVTAANVESYVELPLCDGCLVGGASLKAPDFGAIVKAAQKYMRMDGNGSQAGAVLL